MFKVLVIVFVGNVFAAPTVDFTPINEFSVKLLDHAYSYQENFGKSNLAVSPVSVWSLFSLLAEGSSGQTFSELVQELKLPTDLRQTQALHLATNNLLKSDFQDVLLKGQSAMFSDCTLQIHPEFCKTAISYSTDVYAVDPKNTTKLAHDINYYVCIATEGRITNAVQEKNLENLRLILIDALYFKANWTHPFDPEETKEESFYDNHGKKIGLVNMMYQKAPHNFGDANEIEATVLEMTYGKNEEFSMLFLLPFDGVSIKRLLSNLAAQPLSWIENIRSEGDNPDIDVYIPRFKISSKSDLIPPLQYSGIQTIFDPVKAELPGVSDSPLFISSVIQNVDIEVTEKGTVAASATVVGLEDRILGQRFEANKDFVFMILERRSNLVIFAGTYVVPSVI